MSLIFGIRKLTHRLKSYQCIHSITPLVPSNHLTLIIYTLQSPNLLTPVAIIRKVISPSLTNPLHQLRFTTMIQYG